MRSTEVEIPVSFHPAATAHAHGRLAPLAMANLEHPCVPQLSHGRPNLVSQARASAFSHKQGRHPRSVVVIKFRIVVIDRGRSAAWVI
jgi:hypothetical protein